jgi:glycosyltransferase involved in cell wall biosynthesis
MSPLTFCISTYNNLNYLKIAVNSVRANSYYKDAKFIIHAENCTDGTDEWLKENAKKYNIEYYIDKNDIPLGIGGGMNFCADKVDTEYIMFLHSDFYVAKNWDIECLRQYESENRDKLWISSLRFEPAMFPAHEKILQGEVENAYDNIIVPKDYFGEFYYNFDSATFDAFVEEFIKLNNYTIYKGQGVSGLIKKCDWDLIGGNDAQFSPTSWEDKDLFLRMIHAGFSFTLTSKSVVYHFGARGSHRLEENDGKTSKRQQESESVNVIKFIKKWGGLPIYNEHYMIVGTRPVNINV